MSTAIDRSTVNPPVADADDPSSALSGCLTFAEVAAAYRVRPHTVARWASRGIVGLDGVRRSLPTFRIGRANYVRKSDLAAFLEGMNASG